MAAPTLLRPLILVVAACLVPPVSAQDDELVVVDQAELDRYWRADERTAQTALLGGEGEPQYGCMAVPFVIETDGQVQPGRRPLLIRISPARGGQGLGVDGLYALMMGSLPMYESTWDRLPGNAIYSTRAMVFADRRLVERLGPEAWDEAHGKLQRACRIDDLAGWLGRNDDRTVQEALPADIAQLR
ncbi:MAG: hypothetical protein KF823_07340 [Xanthomonadales bacterium]|nr:hypothetical protein [Xanthomonadales bacterium]